MSGKKNGLTEALREVADHYRIETKNTRHYCWRLQVLRRLRDNLKDCLQQSSPPESSSRVESSNSNGKKEEEKEEGIILAAFESKPETETETRSVVTNGNNSFFRCENPLSVLIQAMDTQEEEEEQNRNVFN